jgi:hypothetical protein
MAKKNATKFPAYARPARGVRQFIVDRAQEYWVYWRSGLKSLCRGAQIDSDPGFYAQRARLILSADKSKQVYVAG